MNEHAKGLLTTWETPESCPNCNEHLSLDWSYCPECGRMTDWARLKMMTKSAADWTRTYQEATDEQV